METVERRESKGEAGAPAWVLTFADLMSLLMAFFVLLFSFSEMDRLKFKELAGSMRDAFGVQREVKTREPPKGVNVVAREFSAGRPEPTVMNVVRQQTTNDLQRHLEISQSIRRGRGSDGPGKAKESIEADAKKVRSMLAEEIDQGLIEVETVESKIIIRIREKGAFPSGRVDLVPSFLPVVQKIGYVINKIPGRVLVAGHTDDRPILTTRFRSNWDLSSARAVTVAHGLLDGGFEEVARITVEGHAETQPIARNEDAEGRARNRRVEVVLVQGEDEVRTSSVSKLGGVPE